MPSKTNETSGVPPLTTSRLLLRGFAPADAPEVARLAGDRDIAATTLTIPHPYQLADAEKWIASQPAAFAEKGCCTFALTLREHGQLIGAMGLSCAREHRRAELGYWIGKPYWGQGYCREAAHAVLAFAFTGLDLHRVHACCFAANIASAKILEKIGMRYEGMRREHICKWGKFVDLKEYGILQSEFRGASR